MFSKLGKISAVCIILFLSAVFVLGLWSVNSAEADVINGECACTGTWIGRASCQSKADWGEVSFSNIEETGICFTSGVAPLQCANYFNTDINNTIYDCKHQRFDPQSPEYTSGSLQYSLNDIETACQGKNIGDSCTMQFTNIKCLALSGSICDFTNEGATPDGNVTNFGCKPGYTAKCFNFDYSNDVCFFSKKTLGSSCTYGSQDFFPYSTACNCESIPNSPPTAPTVDFNSWPRTTDASLNCNRDQDATDPDGDSLTYYWKFTEGGTVLQDWSTSNNFDCSNPGCDKGDSITCHIRAHDGTVYGPEGTASVTIVNSQPTISGLPSDYTLTVPASTSFIVTGSDPDNDAISFSISGIVPADSTFLELNPTNWKFTWDNIGGSIDGSDVGGSPYMMSFNVSDGTTILGAPGTIDYLTITVQTPEPPNTPPSSRLTATGSTFPGQNDVEAKVDFGGTDTKTYNAYINDVITFNAMAWDCDALTDIDLKESGDNLNITNWASSSGGGAIMQCSTGVEDYSGGNEVITLSSGSYTAGNTYNFIINVDDEDIFTPYPTTSTIKVTVAAAEPSPPGNFTLSEYPTFTECLTSGLQWDKSENAVGYRIFRDDFTLGNEIDDISDTGAGNYYYPDTGRTASTLYQYKVQAYNDAGNIKDSNTISITTPACACEFGDGKVDNAECDSTVDPANWNASGKFCPACSGPYKYDGPEAGKCYVVPSFWKVLEIKDTGRPSQEDIELTGDCSAEEITQTAKANILANMTCGNAVIDLGEECDPLISPDQWNNGDFCPACLGVNSDSAKACKCYKLPAFWREVRPF